MEPVEARACEIVRNGAAGAEPRGTSWSTGENLEEVANRTREWRNSDVPTAGWCEKPLRRKPVFEQVQ
jgi:hypothetical protein